MFCSNCGNKIADDARFCSFCGMKVAAMPKTGDDQSSSGSSDISGTGEAAIAAPTDPGIPEETINKGTAINEEPAPAVSEENTVDTEIQTEAPRDDFFDDIKWDVSGYPTSGATGKTKDIDFDWNADPSTIVTGQGLTDKTAAEIKVRAEILEAQKADEAQQNGQEAESEIQKTDEGTASDAENPSTVLDGFYTINRKNEEFQKLLNKEYEKVKAGNTIGDEVSEAEHIAEEKFEARPEDNSMEAFLTREGVDKPYEPKAFETDVLKRIDAQERARERKRLEDEAREKALEEARLEAVARKQKENEAIKAKEEAEAARLQAIEKARLRAEEEAKAKEEAEIKAAQEAAKIKQQQEARKQAEAAEQLKAAEERRLAEEASLKEKLNKEREEITRRAENAAAEEEAKKVLEHTTRMREEEAAKIRAAIAGLRGGLNKTSNQTDSESPYEQSAAATADYGSSEGFTAAGTEAMPGFADTNASSEEAFSAGSSDTFSTGTPDLSANLNGTGAQQPEPVAAFPQAEETPEISENPVSGLQQTAFEAVAEDDDTKTFAQPQIQQNAEQPAFVQPDYEQPADVITPAPEEENDFDLLHLLDSEEDDDVKPVDRSEFRNDFLAAETPQHNVPVEDPEVAEAHQATKDQINDMAKARDTYFATFYNEESFQDQMKKAAAEQSAQREQQAASNMQSETPAYGQQTAAQTYGSAFDQNNANQATNYEGHQTSGADTAARPAAQPEADNQGTPSDNRGTDLTATRVIDKNAILSGLETTRRISKAEIRAQEDREFFESLEAAGSGNRASAGRDAASMDYKDAGQTADQLLNKVENKDTIVVDSFLADLPDAQPEETEAAPAGAPAYNTGVRDDAITEGFAAKDEPSVLPDFEPAAGDRPGLEDTVVMPGREIENQVANEFDNYGVEEAENYRRQQELAAAAAGNVQNAPQEATQQNEIVQPAGEYEDNEGDEEKTPHKVSKLILKIILIILIVIFAAELVGIGIKFLAPQSSAAKAIDSQLNNVIHLISD